MYRQKRRQIATSTSASSSEASKGIKKAKRLTNEDVADYCRQNDIKNINQLLADAETRKVEGDKTLSSFIFSRSLKNISELIEVTWMMKKAVSKVKNLATPRMETLLAAYNAECVQNCNGLWLRCAVDVLQRNKVNKYVYADAMRTLLQKGRGKRRNIFIKGPGDSAKTFLLKPLLLLYPENFTNPAASTFSWMGVEDASIILLNDYRWDIKKNGGNIEWGTLLNLLEGFETNLPAPMNLYSRHVKINTDVPVFGTGPDLPRWYAASPEEIRTPKHQRENDQIDLRWNTFELTHRFTAVDRIDDIPDCPCCFAKLAYLGENE